MKRRTRRVRILLGLGSLLLAVQLIAFFITLKYSLYFQGQSGSWGIGHGGASVVRDSGTPRDVRAIRRWMSSRPTVPAPGSINVYPVSRGVSSLRWLPFYEKQVIEPNSPLVVWFGGEYRGNRQPVTVRFASLPLWIPMLAVALATGALAWRTRRRRGPTECINCGYDLRGTEGDTCSECGHRRVRPSTVADRSRDPVSENPMNGRRSSA